MAQKWGVNSGLLQICKIATVGGLVVFQNLRVFFSLSLGALQSLTLHAHTHTSSNIHEFSSIYLGLFENVENAGYPQPQDSNDSNGQHMVLSENPQNQMDYHHVLYFQVTIYGYPP